MNPRLLLAYRATSYAVDAVIIRIGRRSVPMDALLARMEARTAVFVTAWNPRSRRMPEGWNRRMQCRLAERLRRHVNRPASGSLRRWHEAHLLVAADPRPIVRLARLFRQRGVVVVTRRQAARLVLLEPFPLPRLRAWAAKRTKAGEGDANRTQHPPPAPPASGRGVRYN